MSTKVKPPRWVVGTAIIGMALHLATAADFLEDFTQAPSPDRWRIHGDASLFQWNSAGHLDVTWDTRRTNSFFHHPLGTILGKDDDFTLAFELTLASVQPGINPGKPYTFQLALGLINTADATHTNFFRGEGTGTVRNLVEFGWFPNTGYGATLWPAFWSTNATLSYRDGNDYTLIGLPLQTLLHVTMTYTAADRTMRTSMTAAGQPFGPINELVLSSFFTDFRVDAFAVCSYSDHNSSGSLLAHGKIDNIRLTLPPPPVASLQLAQEGTGWHLQFQSRTDFYYQAEFTRQFDSWTSEGAEVEGTGALTTLPVSTETGLEPKFWRLRVTRP